MFNPTYVLRIVRMFWYNIVHLYKKVIFHLGCFSGYSLLWLRFLKNIQKLLYKHQTTMKVYFFFYNKLLLEIIFSIAYNFNSENVMKIVKILGCILLWTWHVFLMISVAQPRNLATRTHLSYHSDVSGWSKVTFFQRKR